MAEEGIRISDKNNPNSGYDVYYDGKIIGWARTPGEAQTILKDAKTKGRQKQPQKMDDAGQTEKKGEQDSSPSPKKEGGKFGSTILKLKPQGGYSWIFYIILILGVVGFLLWWSGLLTKSLAYLLTALLFIFFFLVILFGFMDEEPCSKWIAIAFLIWAVDMLPIGQPYAGFTTELSGLLTINWLALISTGIFVSLLLIGVITQLIKKEYIFALISLAIIYAINRFGVNYFAFGQFSLNYGSWIFLAILLGFFFIAVFFGKSGSGKEGAVDYFSYVFMILVISYFLSVNTNWMGSLKAWAHLGFVFLFGIAYIRKKSSPTAFHLWAPCLALADFYLYNIVLLFSDKIPGLQFIPILVLGVLIYCLQDEGIESDYPTLALIFLVLILLVFIAPTYALNQTQDIERRKGVSITDFFNQVKDKVSEIIEINLDLATGGLYRGNVEKNRYENLGVYFTNIRAADPRFYTDEPITVWGSIRSKTYQDAVIINFSCYRMRNDKRIKADKIIPDMKFPIFTLEEVDTECTFLPSTEPRVQAGTNIITFSANYNFGTDAYLKTYFIDRDRFRAYARENVDPLKELGIKDKNPVSVSTNGPVEIGMGAGPLVTVSQGYGVKPAIGITLTNRQEIQDKDKKIITKWDGVIKNITELVLLVPPGIEIRGADGESVDESCKKENFEKGDCPCSMPFIEYDAKKCEQTCEEAVSVCVKTCADVYKNKEGQSGNKEDELACGEECNAVYGKCKNECGFLFKSEDTNSKEKYKGYALDVSSLQFRDLNRDIDKHRSFVCRYEPTQAVLGDDPISTKYFRVRARYNYLLENFVTVNVEQSPAETKSTVPDDFKRSLIGLQLGGYEGFTPDLISAIGYVESGWRHCCQEAQGKGTKCTPTTEKSCSFDKLITSGTSFGAMQIKYNTDASKKEVGSIVKSTCNSGEDITNLECNVKVGVEILKKKYNSYSNGCRNSKEYTSYSNIKTACDECKTSPKYGSVAYSTYVKGLAAVRGYNGWGCDGRYDPDYVEKVKNAATKIRNGEIVDNTIKELFSTRQGEGMMGEGETTQTDTVQNPATPTEVNAAYGYSPSTGRYNAVVSWVKSMSSNVINYRVTRRSGNEQAITICDNLSKDVNTCNDDQSAVALEAGKTYTYSVIAYASDGGYSYKDAQITIT